MTNSPDILSLRRKFSRVRVVVLGDVMLDHYIHGDVARISPEAPVPVVDHVREHSVAGGAANVARNLTALEARAELVGVVGRDATAERLRGVLREARIGVRGVVADASRPTTVKTRIVAGHQQLLRLDCEERRPVAAAARKGLFAAAKAAVLTADAVIVADYAKGVLDQELLDTVLAAARRAAVPVAIDPKPARLLKMKGAALLTPNRKETFELAGMSDQLVSGDPLRHAGLKQAIAEIRRRHSPETLLVTLGAAGMLLIEGGKAPRHIPTAAREVYDVSGAGDTVIAAYVLARSAGFSGLEAAMFANRAAGVVVGKLGTATASLEEIAAHA